MQVTLWPELPKEGVFRGIFETLRINVGLMQLQIGRPPAPPPKQARSKVMATRIYMLGSKVNTKSTTGTWLGGLALSKATDFGEDELPRALEYKYHS